VEASTGLRGVLSHPGVYEVWSRLVGGKRGRATLVREHVRPWQGARILDVGCGPGELVPHLGDVHYVGVDLSAAYVERARKLYGDRAEFRVGDATKLDPDLRGFDLVLAFGLVHHLDDEAAAMFYAGVAAALTAEGRAVAVDPALVAGQPSLARVLTSADRGHHVRSPEGYSRLAEAAFVNVRVVVRSDLLRIPYTHCVVEASRG
jgi:SAM-dependent methyltransferase